MSRKVVSKTTEPAKEISPELEAMAKKVHDEYEQWTADNYKKRKVVGYVIMPWADVKPGFYKDNIYKSAQRRLDMLNDPVERKIPKKPGKKKKVVKKKT